MALLTLLLALNGMFALALPGSAATAVQGPETVERSLHAMGTTWTLAVEGPTRSEALLASEAAVAALEAVEARLSTWRPGSELAQLNAAPVGQPVALSPELGDWLQRAWAWSTATAGAFDPAVAPLVRAWDLRGSGRRPTPAEREEAQQASGAAAWDWSALPERVTRLDAAAGLEEGGFGKGAGLDAALEALKGAGATSARLDLGGQVAVLTTATPETTEPLRYAIAHPTERRRGVLAIDLTSGSVATSGNSERGLVVDGARLGHLLDPRTGLPAEDFGSVSVWCTNALDADCLSTALYVLGPERALRFAHETEGVEAVVLEGQGAHLRARATTGLRGRLHTLESATRIEWFAPPADDPSSSPAPTLPLGSR